MITKKLNNQTFAWDPNSFNGKGYWFVLGKNGGFGRAASKTEASQLGAVSKAKTEPATDRVYDYKKARALKKKSLTDLIAEKMMNGGGFFSSTGKSIGEKFKARITRTKEKFDPLNILSALTGRSKLGTAIAGKILGRSKEEMEYQVSKGKKGKSSDTATPVKGKKITPTAGGTDDGELTSVFQKIYNLMRNIREDDIKQKELARNHKEEESEKEEMRHKKLLQAIVSTRGTKVSAVQVKDKNSLFDMLKGLINKFSNILTGVVETLQPLFELMKDGIVSIFRGILKYGGFLLEFLASPAAVVMAGLVASGALAYYLAKWIGDWERDKLRQQGGQKAVEAQKKMNAAEPELVGGTFEAPAYKMSDEYTDAEKEKDSAIQEKQEIVAQLMQAKGYKRYYKTGWFGDRLKNQYSFENTKGEEAADQVIEQVSREADIIIQQRDEQRSKGLLAPYQTTPDAVKQVETPRTATPVEKANESMSQKGPSGRGGSVMSAPGAQKESQKTRRMTPVTPVNKIPESSKVSQVIQQNVALNNNVSTDTSGAPVVINTGKVGAVKVAPDQSTVTGAAAVRDLDLQKYNVINNQRSMMI